MVGSVGKKKNKKNKKQEGPLGETKGLPLEFFLISSQLCASFKLQGLRLVWVQLPKEFFTKKSSQNHHFHL